VEKGKLMSKPNACVFAFASIAIWLGLAVWGWSGISPFFANPARVALVFVTIGLTIASFFTSGNLSAGEKEDRGNRWVLYVFLVIGLADGYFPAYSDRIDFWTFGGDPVRWLGVALFLAGGVLRLWPVFVLGHRFSGLVAIQKDHKLVTDGIFSIVRNPSYLGLVIGVVGWGLAYRSIAGLLLAALFIPPLIGRIIAEERFLTAHFGTSYEAYRVRTWRLLPWIY
jgi:protein-S-isoprenylcysteine O-methyltransferase Ste14